MKKLLLFTCMLALGIGLRAQPAPIDLTMPIPEGWYQIQYTGTRTAGATGYWYINYEKEFAFLANNKYYPVGAVAEIPAGKEARTFFYLRPGEGTAFYLQAINGHYVSDTGKSTVAPSLSYINDAYNGFKFLLPFGEGTDPGALNHEFDYFVGRSYNAVESHSVFPVEMENYDIYRVVIECPEEESHDFAYDYSTVTYVGSEALSSISTVYNEGWFIFPKGTTVAPEDFEGTPIENYDFEAYIDGNKNIVMTYQPAVDFATITYYYYYGDEEVGSEEVLGVVGEAYPAPKYGFPYGVSVNVPEGTVSDDEQVDLQVVVAGLPFQYKDQISSLDDVEHWYHLVLKNASYVVYDPGIDYISLTYTEVDLSNKDAYRWAFVGNPFTGYKLVNKSAGIDYVLASSNTANNDGNGGGNTLCTMQELSTLDESADAWMFLANKSTYIPNVDGFFLGYYDAANSKIINMNNRSNKLAYWDSGADSGSTFYCVEVFGPEKTLADAIANATAVKEQAATTMGKVGYPSTLAVDSMTIVIAEAQAIYDQGTAEEAEYFNAASTLSAAINKYKAMVMFPEDDKYYAFVNHQQDGTFITMYMTEEGLVAGVNRTPEELGDSATFYSTIYQDEDGDNYYIFFNPLFERYLVWRGKSGGHNDNKGYTEEITEFNPFYLFSSQRYLPGTFLLAGYRGNGAVGTFIFLTSGAFDAFSLNYGWTASYSNLFTVEEVDYDDGERVDTLTETPADAVLYDLFGRRVVQPVPGTVYINSQKGKVLIR